MFELFLSIVPVILVVMLFSLLIYNHFSEKRDERKEEKKDIKIEPKQIRKLSKEKIEEIHKRGNITAEEKVKEWESFGLCAPGDAIGSAAYRCKSFNNCHECLCDYAADFDEYRPMEFKVVNHIEDEELELMLKKLD